MKPKQIKSIHSKMQRFADLTKVFIMKGNLQRAHRCLQVAESIFKNGSSACRNSVVNVYVYSVSQYLEIHHCDIRSFFPEILHSEYQKQVNASGT